MTIKIGKITFNRFTHSDAQNEVCRIIETTSRCHQVVIANAYSLVLAHKNEQFAEVCSGADLVFADGKPVVWASLLLKDRIPERIAGPDFMWSFSRICALKGYKVFLMGGQEPFLARLKENMEREFKDINIVGTYSPPFGEWSKEESKKIISLVNHSKADILWVGVSTPKQDIWIADHKSQIKAKIAFGVGAAFDFHSGKIKRAPEWMQHAGFEWLHRLISEPKRLWRRYIIGNAQFLLIVFRQIIINIKESIIRM